MKDKVLKLIKSKTVIVAGLSFLGAVLVELGAPGSLTGLIDAIIQFVREPAVVAQ